MVHLSQIFMDNIVRLHGLLENITSNRDAHFTSTFWKELFRLQGTKLAFSYAYHLQSDGKTEVVNRTLEVVYGRPPPRLVSYLAGSSRVASIDQALMERDSMLVHIRDNLLKAQSRMKNSHDKAHRDHSYAPGDYILERIGSVTYRLQLPADAHIHDLFHVSLLKSFKGDLPLLHTPLPPLHDGRILPTPSHVYQARKVNDSWELLVHRAVTDPVEAFWQPSAEFRELFPDFELEYKLFL
ncbi:uncharacterized protein [Aristolochia californica]|uniref:uncharacterized protein n=1 Tax=Aristolochia californica TaxID=171875 RepID=UPI0035DAF0DB